jgi:hypothetical protein
MKIACFGGSASIALATAIAVPSAASAAAPSAHRHASKHAEILVAGPVRVHAYKLYLLASPAHPHDPANVLAIFERGTDNDRQTHYYGFSHGVSVRISPDGTGATIKANLQAYGRIDLTFATGPGGPAVASLPPVCNGTTIGQHSGTVTGTTRFDVNTHSSYFGTVHETSLPAFVTTVRSQGPNCKPKQPSPAVGVTQLSTTSTQPGRSLTSLTASRSARGDIAEDVLLIDQQTSPTGPAVLHAIDATALPQPAFTYASDLSSAHVTGRGSFLSGSLDFAQTFRDSPSFVMGTTTGAVEANFDGLGTLQLQTPPVLATITQ